MLLPPKMAEHYAALAREGKADRTIGKPPIVFIFNSPGQPSNEIVLVTIEKGRAQGHISRKRGKS